MTSIDGVDPTVPPSGDGCLECLSGATPGWWFHLRRCAPCGHVGCCDSSPNQHARGHFAATGHRYVQSFEPGEDWFWDFVGMTTREDRPWPLRGTTPTTSRSPGRQVPFPRTGCNTCTRRTREGIDGSHCWAWGY